MPPTPRWAPAGEGAAPPVQAGAKNVDLKPSAANRSLWRKGRYLKRRQQKFLWIHRDRPLQLV